MEENRAMGVIAVLVFASLTLLFVGLDSKITPYIVICAVILLFVAGKGDFSHMTLDELSIPAEAPSSGELDPKEKKLLVFHILTLIEKKKTIDMSEIAADLEVSIYALTDILRHLSKHGYVNVIYPPMKSFPVIREGDPEKSRKLRRQIYHAIAKKNIMGKPIKENFAKEVEVYLQERKRKRKTS